MKSSLLLLLFGLITQMCFGQEFVSLKGKLITKETNVPVAYAAITDHLNNRYGTTSQEDGTFTLKIPKESTKEIYIQAIGYRDTVITSDQWLDEPLTIYLTTVTYSLPTAYVSNKTARTESVLAGTPNGAVITRKGKAIPTFASTAAGLSSGVFIKPKKKHRGGVLSKISFYVVEAGFPQAPSVIRILVSNIKLQKNRMYPSEQFKDLLKEPIIHSGKVGWNTIDIEHLNLPAPDQNFILLFTPLDFGDKYRWINKYQTGPNGYSECYGIAIGTYREKKLGNIFLALQRTGGALSYIKAAQTTPAVAVQYVK